MDSPARFEVEIRLRRNGRLYRRESAIGADPLMAFESASNDLIRELQNEGTDRG